MSRPVTLETHRPSYRPYRPGYRPLYRPLRNLTPNPETVEVVLKWCLEEPILGGSHGLYISHPFSQQSVQQSVPWSLRSVRRSVPQIGDRRNPVLSSGLPSMPSLSGWEAQRFHHEHFPSHRTAGAPSHCRRLLCTLRNAGKFSYDWL